MPAKKTTSTPSFDATAAFQKVTESFDITTMQTRFFDGLAQGQQATLDGVKSALDAFSKVAPEASFPFADEFQKSAQTGIDFATKFYASQVEFASSLLKVLVPAS